MNQTSKTLSTLVDDIYGILDRGVDHTPRPDYIASLTKNIEDRVHGALKLRNKPRELGKLWFSDLGENCARKIWYKFNAKETDAQEQLPGNALFKFMYGDLIESQVLYLAQEAGHTVTNEQERIEWTHPNGWIISGRIDAVIDGVLVDVKSTSPIGFKKYANLASTTNDTFGYLWQLSGYAALANREQIPFNGSPAFVFVDKQNGHIRAQPIEEYSKEQVQLEVIRVSNAAASYFQPERGYKDIPVGKSGNIGLGVECSYCPYKQMCWDGLRGFAYSNGPVWLTHIEREPDVPEII
jgi:hypothetical protein